MTAAAIASVLIDRNISFLSHSAAAVAAASSSSLSLSLLVGRGAHVPFCNFARYKIDTSFLLAEICVIHINLIHIRTYTHTHVHIFSKLKMKTHF
jgi:hypothetical protein